MKVGIFHVGNNPGHLRMGAFAVAAAHRAMPHIEVCHLTDDDTPAFAGAVAIRRRKEVPLAVFRMQHHAALAGEWLFIDSDVVVAEGVAHVFDGLFDIAIAARPHNDNIKEEQLPFVPHNSGVVFSRCPRFWRAAEIAMELQLPVDREWMGDQYAICQLIRMGVFRTMVLAPGYNWPPRDVSDATGRILHFKGSRKHLIEPVAERLGVQMPLLTDENYR